MDMTTSYLYISVLCFIAYVDSQITVSAQVGSTAVLPCKLSTLTSQAEHVKWQRNIQTVFERTGMVLYQGDEYRGRVDVPLNRLRKGNCSLVLKKISKADAGVYESYRFITKRKKSDNVLINTVILRVLAKDKKRSYKKWLFLGKAVMDSPYSLIVLLFLLSWLLVCLFCQKTSASTC